MTLECENKILREALKELLEIARFTDKAVPRANEFELNHFAARKAEFLSAIKRGRAALRTKAD